MRQRRLAVWSSSTIGTAIFWGALLAAPAVLQAQSITTIAGGGKSSQEGLPAKSVILSSISGLATDHSGNVYIAEGDGNVIDRVSVLDGTVTAYAGNGGGTFSGDGGPARLASLKGPKAIVFDDAGNLFIADHDNGRVRRVDAATGVITTVAGSDFDPNRTGNGDGGPATSAFLSGPWGLAWHAGSLFVTDTGYGKNVVRKIDSHGTITTVVGKETAGGFTGDNGQATQAELRTPLAVAVDAGGNLYVADSENGVVRRVDVATGLIVTVVGGGTPADDIGDGGPGTGAKLALPAALAFDAAGNLLIADAYNQNGRIRKYNPVTKIITSIAGNGQYGGGDDGPATDAGVYAPVAIAIDAAQNVFVNDASNGTVRRIDASTHVITRVAGGGTFIGDGRVAAAAVLQDPLGIAFDTTGNLLITDPGHSLIRSVTASTGIISTIAGRLNDCCGENAPDTPATAAAIGFPRDVALDHDGLINFVGGDQDVLRINANGTVTLVAGGGDPADGVGDGGPATAAHLNALAISFDTEGNLYVVDHAYGAHHRIRKVTRATGVITTIAGSDIAGFSGDNGPAVSARLDTPSGVAVDSARNVYIADTSNGAIRRIDGQTGVITTYAGRGTPADGIGDGGPATEAGITPLHMAIDRRNDDLYFADQNGHRVRKIDARSHVITTVAGKGTFYGDRDFSGDNGPATSAKLNLDYELSGVAIDAHGRVFVSDSKNGRVRMINACGSVPAPLISQPADGSVTSTGPSLSWSPAAGASHYDVYLDTVNPPTKIAASDLSVTSFTPSNLQPGVHYFWQVVAKGDPFCSPVATAGSRVSSFTTSGRCSVGGFDLVSPGDGATTSTAIVTLSWQPSAGASTYDVYLGAAGAPVLVASGLTSTTFDATVGFGTYAWFVVAHAGCDPNRTGTTSIRTFQSSVIGTCSAPQLQVTLSSPAAGADDQSTSVDLVWSANAGVTSYDLYLGSVPAAPLFASGINATHQLVNGLIPETTYYWRVVARDVCNPSGVTSEVRNFSTKDCEVPGAVTLLDVPQPVAVGATYALVWSVAPGLDADGGYLVERSLSPTFSSAVESQVTSSTAATFLASATGTYYHRVRAVPACDPLTPGPVSEVKGVVVSAAKPNVVFTVLPTAVVASLGERIEDRRGTFALENIGTDPVQVIVGRQELGSTPFFSIVDPTATDAAFVTLQPNTPKSFEIRYAGPANDHSGSYQGVIFAASTGAGLAVTPYAFVNLKIGGGAAAVPQISVDGAPAEYVAFPGFAGDDSTRPARVITITNPGSTPMDLAAEIGPEVWLTPQTGWNATPLAPGETRSVSLSTKRSRSPNGSPLPRYTYFTVRTRDGASSRVLVQDNDDIAVAPGRSTRLDLSIRSFLVPELSSRLTSAGTPLVSRLRLSNIGGESVQAELVFTRAGADGFDAAGVQRATVILPPNDLLTLTDPLVQLFHLQRPVTGSLEVRIPAERLGLVAVSSSLIATGGRGGYDVPTVNRGEGARAGFGSLIGGIVSSGSTSTALTLAETSGVDDAAVRVVFFDELGVNRGETTATIPRYGSRRFDSIASLISGGALQAGHLEVSVESGGGSVVAMAVVGNADGGATLMSVPVSRNESSTAVARLYAKEVPQDSGSASITTVVPVIANPSSSGASVSYATSVGLLAPSSAPASFVATYRNATGAAAVVRTVSVASSAVKIYGDVASELFGAPAGSGSVSVQTSSGGKVFAVIKSSTGGGAATPASSLPFPTTLSEALTSAGGGAQRPLFFDGLEQSTDSGRGSRWMLVLNEVAGSSGVLNVRLYEAGNRSRPIAEKNLPIAPYEQRQLDTVFSELGLDAADRRKDRTNVQVVVTAVGGSARVAAMAVAVDNKTADTKAFALTPTVGSATPSVSVVSAVIPTTKNPRRRNAGH